jgi:hypothetical protein
MAMDLSNKAWNKFLLSDVRDMNVRISKNFQYWELVKSETAARNAIDNRVRSTKYLRSVVYVCRNVLQPIRDKFGQFIPNSVYRSQELERALKKKPVTWLSTSQHAKGEAVDIEVPKVTNLKLAEWCTKNLDTDQVILEMYDPNIGPNSGWVHVSTKPGGIGNRHVELSYVKQRGKYVYVKGFVTDDSHS